MSSSRLLRKVQVESHLRKLMQVMVASAAMLLLCLPASSQSLQLGHISGVVTDQQGGIITNATSPLLPDCRAKTRNGTSPAIASHDFRLPMA